MKERIDRLYPKIASRLIETPLLNSLELGALLGCNLYLKMENEQTTGSFKLRGVLSKFSDLHDLMGTVSQVVAASTGNHAAAVCHVASYYQCQPVIFVPRTITPNKLEKLKATNARVLQEGSHSGESELLALDYAREHGVPMIHPYNDPAVIAGQGTIGYELCRQLDHFDSVFVPVGGGGLISGIAGYLKEALPRIEVVGVQPKNASEMAASIKAGKLVPPSEKFTISDGTAGGLDPDTITVDLCRQLVDKFILVEENEIVRAMKMLHQYCGVAVEPSAALALAGVIRSGTESQGKTCVVIVCGGNIDKSSFQRLINE